MITIERAPGSLGYRLSYSSEEGEFPLSRQVLCPTVDALHIAVDHVLGCRHDPDRCPLCARLAEPDAG